MILLISVLQGRREAFELAIGWGSSGSRRRMRERDEHEMNLSSFVTILMSKYLSFTCGNERVLADIRTLLTDLNRPVIQTLLLLRKKIRH